MSEVKEVVDFYLTSDSSHAILITGEWGIGKTYFFKNVLSNQIKQTPLYGNASKNYNPILISLFGLKSIEDIQTTIFLSIYSFLQDKRIKIASSIVKTLIKGIAQFKGVNEYTDIIADVTVDKKDWINFNELVLCFDDFERINNELSIDEIIGFINSLVDGENVKVIILANEDKIEPENYKVIKEKVIGNTIEFTLNKSLVFDNIIETKFISYSNYQSFLKAEKDYITDIFFSESSNLRTLNFVLMHMQHIYSSYRTTLQANDILNEHENEILRDLLKFTLIIGILYKQGDITFKNTNGMEGISLIPFRNFFDDKSKEKKEADKTLVERIHEKFYKDEYYRFYPSIYNFLTGGNAFNPLELINELKKRFNIEDNEITLPYQVLNELGYNNVFNLKDAKYRKLTRDMLLYNDEGHYLLQECTTIFYFALRFNNPLNLNIERLEKRILKSITKNRGKYKYNPALRLYYDLPETAEYRENLKRIADKAKEVNEGLNNHIKNLKFASLEETYNSNFEFFFSQLIDKKNENRYMPLFENFSPYKFYRFLLRSDGIIIRNVTLLFEDRYYNFPPRELKPETKFLKGFQKIIDKKLNSMLKKGVTFFLMNELNETIKKSILQLNRDENIA